MLYNIRFADDDYLSRQQDVTKLGACKKQTKAKFFHVRVPRFGVQHPSAEIKYHPFLVVV
jgi:hypothetical protein